MIAVDTNVLVRILTNDDPAQARRALTRMQSETVWIARTVLLETEWVLRHAYALDAAAIQRALSGLLAVGNIEVEDQSVVTQALSWHARGMDLADALHLAARGDVTAFVSFDRRLARTAKRVGTKPAVTEP